MTMDGSMFAHQMALFDDDGSVCAHQMALFDDDGSVCAHQKELFDDDGSVCAHQMEFDDDGAMCAHQMELAVKERCELLPFLSPKRVVLTAGRISAVEFVRSEQDDDGQWSEDPDQTAVIKADFVITAFGSALTDDDGQYRGMRAVGGTHSV